MKDYSRLIELLKLSKRTVALTGAGVSTLSGIPDFRSTGGLYSKRFGSMRVEELLDISFFTRNPDEFYHWARDNWYRTDKCDANIVHRMLALLEEKGLLSLGIFTQNIDALHQRAGSKQVYELHGSLSRGYCMNCHSYHTYSEIASIVQRNEVPRCSFCGGLIKPDIIFYGESLDSNVINRAEIAFSQADLCLVMGSSLVVNPAASLPLLTLRNNGKVVIINRDKTYLDRNAILTYPDLGELSKFVIDSI